MPAFQRNGWKRYEFIKRVAEWCGVGGGHGAFAEIYCLNKNQGRFHRA